jgi:hypothetical protein
MASQLTIWFLCSTIQDFFSNPDLWKELVTGTASAILGFTGAYLIFNRGLKKEKDKEVEKRDLLQKDNLRYFVALLKNIIDMGKDQSVGYKEYADNLKKEPLKDHLISSIVSRDLKRASERLDVQTYYLAYISQLPNTGESAVEFNEIIKNFDFIDALNDDVNRILREEIDIVSKMKYRLAEKFETVLDDAKKLVMNDNFQNITELANIKTIQNYTPLIDFLGSKLNDFYLFRENTQDYSAAKNIFLEPLQTFLSKPEYVKHPYLLALFWNTNECLKIYSHINSEINKRSAMFNEFGDQMAEATKSLIKSSNRLLNVWKI